MNAPATTDPQTTTLQPATAKTADEDALARLVLADARFTFGPTFFLTQLAALVRDRCPDESEPLPEVTISLVDGEAVEVCHIAAVSSRWVALAVRGQSPPAETMPTLLVPYETIARMRIADHRHREGGTSIGFDCARTPTIVGPLAGQAVRGGADP